jgi:hypothetical protein
MALPDLAYRVIGPGYRVYCRRSPIHIPILRLEPR